MQLHVCAGTSCISTQKPNFGFANAPVAAIVATNIIISFFIIFVFLSKSDCKLIQPLFFRKMRPNAARASLLAVVLREGADNPLATKIALFTARDACQSSHDKRMIRDVVSGIFHLQP
jgi:hypothetical protein